ncbi:MAG: hypothetical protein KAU03_04055, partial [Candidatus Altiarchaeales archaeon]|nr:hypothetical protein [Candidatus Altiarchaeales archaeon]
MGSVSSDETETYRIDIPSPDLVEKDGYYLPVIEGYDSTSKPYHPMLPHKSIFIEIPENAREVKAKVTGSKPVSLGKITDIAIVPPP